MFAEKELTLSEKFLTVSERFQKEMKTTKQAILFESFVLAWGKERNGGIGYFEHQKATSKDGL